MVHRKSQFTLHMLFYNKSRKRYHWSPTRIIEGCYREFVKRTKSFMELEKRLPGTDKPGWGR